ncbi:1-phosphatidylinositol 4-kinase [Malassezia yamatoensis]|uniref:1-phosphatidylinositol 4-kinase n=1 Tax=Malassezia yamatoensis TaxID=253288 RepID=A0AAJ5YN87_9BASI|nr:1-phosphatidylinositol 4-kinase [Malassezia yamatoensis]
MSSFIGRSIGTQSYGLIVSHLLITRASESRALESFILRRCEEDVHLALITLWYIQAQLADLRDDPTSLAFRTCQRVYNRCQRILFEEADSKEAKPRSALQRFLPMFDARSKVLSCNSQSCLVGMGASLIGAASPPVALFAGGMALQQGRRPLDGDLSEVRETRSPISSHTPQNGKASEQTEPIETPIAGSSKELLIQQQSMQRADSQTKDSQPSSARSATFASSSFQDEAQENAHSTPSDSVHDTFGQNEEAQMAMRFTQHTSISTPSLVQTAATTRSNPPMVEVKQTIPLPESDLNEYSYAAQQQALRSHYGRTETQFLQSLLDIATRLQPLPKLARLSALRAELTALNHTLPTEVCFPTWCLGTPKDPKTASAHERHHRVVRISASEAVVLNSADRVPYLLHVEVLRNDLDFEPERRSNRTLLQRILGHKQASTPLAKLVVPRTEKRASDSTITTMSSWKDQDKNHDNVQQIVDEPDEPSSSTKSEEMDLTEQIYGSDLSAFGAEKESEDQLQEKNRTIDSAAWASAASASRADFTIEEYAERMRTAAVMLAQLNNRTANQQPVMTHTPPTRAPQSWSSWIVGTPAPEPDEIMVSAPTISAAKVLSVDTEKIRQRIMDEMAALEEQRMERMKKGGMFFGKHRPNPLAAADETAVLRAVNKDDPSAAYFRESWLAKRERIRSSSPYGHIPTWDLFSVIVKTGADLRQEQFAVQLINEFRRVWQETQSRCWVHYFRIVVLNEDAGLIETITDAISIHSIKKDAYAQQLDGRAIATYTLYDHFVQTYGEPHTMRFRQAQKRFAESLAGYAIVSYLLQIKDRHNGNILVDTEGHLIHIDFGFMLGISPGGVGFEAAPFKLPKDYIEILGGMEGDGFLEFKALMRQGFRDVRKHAERFIMLVELMQKDSKLPCFALGELATSNLRDRFQLTLSATQCDEFVDRLILTSAGSAFTRLYDQYQNFTQNIL